MAKRKEKTMEASNVRAMYDALAAMLSCAEKEAPFTSESGMSIAMNMARKAIKKAGGES